MKGCYFGECTRLIFDLIERAEEENIPGILLLLDFEKAFDTETTGPNGTKLGRKHLYKVLYKFSSFRPNPPTNMTAKGNSCF
jgi:hypothetical protein